MATPGFAAGAYASIQGVGAGNLMRKPLATGGAEAGGPDFSALLGKALDATAEAGRKADTQTASVAGGRADIVNVVTAIAAAETQLETVMAVRDQVIQAYQEILRMPI